jgi:hypothetical protein
MRAAAHADELPLATPFTDRRGVQRASVPVRKGEMVAVPIRLVNHDTAIWGADAGEWRCVLRPLYGCSSLMILSHRPERWMDGSVGEKAKAIPGLWGSTMAFSGGSHSCIGYKFTIYECVAPHLLLSPLFLTRAQGEADPARAELHVRRRARGPARGHRQDRRHHVAPVRDEPEGGGRADARHLAPRRGGRVSGDLGIFMAATGCGCGASYFIYLLLDWAQRRTDEATRLRQPRSTARSSS